MVQGSFTSGPPTHFRGDMKIESSGLKAKQYFLNNHASTDQPLIALWLLWSVVPRPLDLPWVTFTRSVFTQNCASESPGTLVKITSRPCSSVILIPKVWILRGNRIWERLCCCCCCSVSKSCLVLCDPVNCSTPGFSVLHYLLEIAQSQVHWIETLPIKCPKYWSFSFSISPSRKYSGLVSFRIDWFDLLAVQGTLKSLLQYHNSKASIVWRSTFLMVQLSKDIQDKQ